MKQTFRSSTRCLSLWKERPNVHIHIAEIMGRLLRVRDQPHCMFTVSKPTIGSQNRNSVASLSFNLPFPASFFEAEETSTVMISLYLMQTSTVILLYHGRTSGMRQCFLFSFGRVELLLYNLGLLHPTKTWRSQHLQRPPNQSFSFLIRLPTPAERKYWSTLALCLEVGYIMFISMVTTGYTQTLDQVGLMISLMSLIKQSTRYIRHAAGFNDCAQ